MDTIIPEERLRLRRAELYDALIIYKWALDREARINSISGKKFTFEQHYEWYQGKLKNDHCRIFILEANFPIGQIRFDFKENLWVISYAIDENFRNQGMGQRIVGMGLDLMGRGQYLAKVKRGNMPSIRIFHKLNFREVKEEHANPLVINFIYEKE